MNKKKVIYNYNIEQSNQLIKKVCFLLVVVSIQNREDSFWCFMEQRDITIHWI